MNPTATYYVLVIQDTTTSNQEIIATQIFETTDDAVNFALYNMKKFGRVKDIPSFEELNDVLVDAGEFYKLNEEIYTIMPASFNKKKEEQNSDKGYQELLCKWGFQGYPKGVPLKELTHYIQNGVPHQAIEIMSNSSGYFKLLQDPPNGRPSESRFLLFDDITNYGPQDMNDIDPSVGEFKSDKNYHLRQRVLLFAWTDVEKIWLGKDQEQFGKKYDGNTCLLKLKTKAGEKTRYRMVRGGFIVEFDLEEQVRDYYSFLDNNTAPFPLVLTKTRLYIPEYNLFVKISSVPEDINLMTEFSGYFYNEIFESEDNEEGDGYKVIYDSDDGTTLQFEEYRCGKCSFCED